MDQNSYVFEGFKFQTSFNFKSKREKTRYFNDLLFYSDYLFQEKQKQYFSERLHVLFSYSTFFRWMSIALGIIAILSINTSFGLPIWGAMALSEILHMWLNRMFRRKCIGYSFTIEFNEQENFLNFLKHEISMGKKIDY